MPAIHPPPALEPGLPRRAVLRAWACVVLAAALPAAQAGEETMMEFTYSIGVNTVPGTALIDATAKDLDLWRKHGLKPVTPPPLGGGDRRAWSPEEENHSDVRLYGMGATINYISKGVEFVIVADLGTRAEWHMWSLAGTPMDAQQMRGKRLAVTQLSGTDRLYANFFLKSLGVRQDEVTFVPTGGVPQNYRALRNGEADIWITTEHSAILIDRENRLRSVGKMSDFVGKNWDPYVVVAKKSTVSNNPELVRKALAVILQAADHVDKAPRQENVARLMTRFNVDEATAEKLLATITLNPSGKINQATIEKMRDHYVETGVIPASSPPADSMYTARWVGRRD